MELILKKMFPTVKGLDREFTDFKTTEQETFFLSKETSEYSSTSYPYEVTSFKHVSSFFETPDIKNIFMFVYPLDKHPSFRFLFENQSLNFSVVLSIHYCEFIGGGEGFLFGLPFFSYRDICLDSIKRDAFLEFFPINERHPISNLLFDYMHEIKSFVFKHPKIRLHTLFKSNVFHNSPKISDFLLDIY